MSWDNFKFSPDAAQGWIFLVLLGGYALGCIATGYYLVRLFARQDVRNEGSGNIGATNVGRVLGAWGFAVVLLLDLGKGALAVGLARHFIGGETAGLLAMSAVTAGHIWPVQLGFRGGKGVSASLGALLVFDWRLALTFAAVAAVGWAVVRSFSLGGMVAFLLLPLMAFAWRQTPATAAGVSLMAALVLIAHRKNIEEVLVRFNNSRHGRLKPEEKT